MIPTLEWPYDASVAVGLRGHDFWLRLVFSLALSSTLSSAEGLALASGQTRIEGTSSKLLLKVLLPPVKLLPFSFPKYQVLALGRAASTVKKYDKPLCPLLALVGNKTHSY